MKVEFNELLLNENAYFYKVKRRLLPRDVQMIFEESLRDKKGTRKFESKVRESFVHGASEIAKISLDIFEYKKRPSFLKKEVKGVFETKFGLFLIVEVGDFIAVIRKNVSGVDTFDSLVDKIDYNILTRFLLKENSKYEKLVTSNMNAASKAIQRKTSEADDLQGIFSRFGASKQILNSLRVDNEGHKSTVTINTSRVNSFNLQRDFDAIIVWMVNMVKLIRLALKNPPQSNFIDSFASPINFKDKISDLAPAYLLLRFGVLKDEIENGHIQRLVHKGTKKRSIWKEKFLVTRDFLSSKRQKRISIPMVK